MSTRAAADEVTLSRTPIMAYRTAISSIGQTNSVVVDVASIARRADIEPEATVQTIDSGSGRPVPGCSRYG